MNKTTNLNLLNKLLLTCLMTAGLTAASGQTFVTRFAENSDVKGAVRQVKATTRIISENGSFRPFSDETIETFNRRGAIIDYTKSFKGRIERRKIFSYDDAGKITGVKDLSPESAGVVLEESRIGYDRRGNEIEEQIYKNGALASRNLTFYDPVSNKESRYESITGDERVWTTYDYDSQGNKKNAVSYSVGVARSRTAYKYNAANLMTEHAYYDSQDKLVERILMTYDAQNRLLESAVVSGDGRKVKKSITFYAPQGKRREAKYFYDDVLLGSEFSKYDAKGNVVDELTVKLSCGKPGIDPANPSTYSLYYGTEAAEKASKDIKNCTAPLTEKTVRKITGLLFDRRGNWTSRILRRQFDRASKPVVVAVDRRVIQYYDAIKDK